MDNPRFTPVSSIIKIRPLWDWNLTDINYGFTDATIKIRPLWDWNWIRWGRKSIRNVIKIRPLWDWNEITASADGTSNVN